MKIVVATIGSRGDVQPYINLSQGLLAAGHTVTLATNPSLCPLAAAHGVPAAAVGPAVDMGAEGARLMAHSFNNLWISMIRVMRLAASLVEAAYPDVLKLCRGADLVITSDTGSGIAEAEKLGVPWISVTLQPGRIPVNKPNPPFLQRIVWGVLNQLFILPINRARRRQGAPLVKDIASMLSSRMILLPVSRHVAPLDPLWPDHVHATGYWFARESKDWQPPQDLLDFLATGGKPIVISLGVMSHSGEQARQGVQIVLQAVQQAGVRAVIQGWDEALQDLPLPKNVFHAGSLPHTWLFKQASAIVHHGGFGTTAASLWAGAPVVIIPHVIDQFYWGQRAFELGVGPKFITRGQLRTQNLAEAIQQAVSDPKMRLRAAELGGKIQAEPDGVPRAVEVIEEKFGR